MDKKYPWQKYFTIQQVWLSLPLVLTFILLNITPIKEGDLWWHMRVGEEIVNSKAIPTVDTFTFTANGIPYFFYYSWLSDVLFYVFYGAGGFSALILSQTLIGCLMVGLLLYQSHSQKAPVPLTVSFTLLSFVGLYPFITTRPQVFSFLLFVCVSVILSAYLDRRLNRLGFLPILMILWVNLHSAWVIGVTLVLATWLLNAMERLWTHQGLDRQLSVWSGLCMLGILINPEGIFVLQNVIAVGNNPIIQGSISEWQPTLITSPLSWAFFISMGVWIAGLAYSHRRLSFRKLGLMLLVTFLALRYVRMLPFYFAIATPIVVELTAGLDWTGLRQRIANFRPIQTPDAASNNRAILNLILILTLLIGCVVSLPPVRLALTGKPATSLLSAEFPIEAVDYLAEHLPPGAHLFNLPEWGGYLIWRLYPQALVFADGRVEMYPVEFWDDYVAIVEATPRWQELLDRYQADTLVLSKNRQAKLILTAYAAGWNCIQEDAVAIVLSHPGNPNGASSNLSACPSLLPRK